MITFSDHLPERSGAILAAVLLALQPIAAAAQAGPDQAQAKTSAAASEARNFEPLSGKESTGVLGKSVVGPNGEELGLITDVIVAPGGQPRAAVIDVGGFLGVGTRKVAIDWNLLRFSPTDRHDKIVATIDRRELQDAPEYRADAGWVQLVGPPLVGPSTGPDEGQ